MIETENLSDDQLLVLRRRSPRVNREVSDRFHALQRDLEARLIASRVHITQLVHTKTPRGLSETFEYPSRRNDTRHVREVLQEPPETDDPPHPATVEAVERGNDCPRTSVDPPDTPSEALGGCARASAQINQPEGLDMTALTAREVADAIGTEPKTLRMFLRSDASGYSAAGAGGRYSFTAADLPKIKTKFAAWQKDRSAKAKPDSTPPAKVVPAAKVATKETAPK